MKKQYRSLRRVPFQKQCLAFKNIYFASIEYIFLNAINLLSDLKTKFNKFIPTYKEKFPRMVQYLK